MRRIILLTALALAVAVSLPGALSARGGSSVSNLPAVTPNLTGADVNAYGGVASGGTETATPLITQTEERQTQSLVQRNVPEPLRYGGVAFPE